MFDYVCKTVMPSSIRQQCIDFISENEPTLLQLLLNCVLPSDACTVIKVCYKNQITQTQSPILGISLSFKNT